MSSRRWPPTAAAPGVPRRGDGAPGTAATTPDGLPVPTTAPGGSGGDGGSSSGGSGTGSGGTSSESGGLRRGFGLGRGRHAHLHHGGARRHHHHGGGAHHHRPVHGHHGHRPTEGDAGGEPPADPPSPVFGKRWQVLLMAQGGVSRPMGTEKLLSVDARTEGQLTIAVCNRTPASASVDGDHLVVAVGTSAGRACGEPLDGHQTFLTAFFDADPSFSVDGNRLVLTVGNRRVELTAY
ncbi:MAG: META domain-containing protein [Acidimicrobiales bacterium]